jgi:transcriptional regulator with XRE-family HTH domain
METLMKLDSERLKMLRELRGWSQEQLASAAGVSVRTVQRTEADGSASRETKICLAAALDVPHSDLEAKAQDASHSGQVHTGQNFAELVHNTLGTTFLLIGSGFLGSSLFLGYSPFMTYLGGFFAFVGCFDLIMARIAKRSTRIRARSVA